MFSNHHHKYDYKKQNIFKKIIGNSEKIEEK